MSEFVQTRVAQRTGIITLDRPKALNSLSLAMVRDLTEVLLAWRLDPAIDAVVLCSSSEKALCAGGDIRFFTRWAMPRRWAAAHCWKTFSLKNTHSTT